MTEDTLVEVGRSSRTPASLRTSRSPSPTHDRALASARRTPLPQELVALVHHVQLNESDWWTQAVHRLIIGVLWLLDGGTVDLDRLVRELHHNLKLTLSAERVSASLAQLVAKGAVIEGGDGYRLAEHVLRQCESDLRRTDEMETRVRERFEGLVATHVPTLSGSHDLWIQFTTGLLYPTIAAAGARTYELIKGGFPDFDKLVTMQQFLGRWPAEARAGIQRAVTEWLDPADPDVRAYLLRQMNACFVVEASSLSGETLAALTARMERRVMITGFVDSNVGFSLLGMHGDDANEAARQLATLARAVTPHVDVQLRILPPTVVEARTALETECRHLSEGKWTPAMARAALKSETLTHMGNRFATAVAASAQPMRPADYFEPYVRTPLKVLETRGVTLYNATLSPYESNADVDRDVDMLFTAQQRGGRRSGDGQLTRRHKTKARLRHDVILWHFVRDRRSPSVESPLDATYWIITEDRGAIAFDRLKAKNDPHHVPVCIHPTALIQMLQLWVGRTPELEEALVGSLRLNLLVHDFNPEAERVTLRILEQLAAYEHAPELPERVITATLVNSALRQRVARARDAAEERVAVHDTVIEEAARLASELAAAQAYGSTVKHERDEATSALARLKTDAAAAIGDAQRDAAAAHARDLDAERAQRERLESQIAALDRSLKEHREADTAREREAALRAMRRRFTWRQALLGVGAVLASGAESWALWNYRTSLPFWWPTPAVAIAMGALWLWAHIVKRQGDTHPALQQSRIYVIARRVARILGVVSLAATLGTVGNFATLAFTHPPSRITQPVPVRAR